ncbi:protein inscuteable homolog [Monomorium pharaonis]|uniref:protein inscuteable homolog n=1 Tax=Monomorium pharaonis TaxID=307658 RepID=UPI00063FBA67|nr:protein inscuteable homolog [Monomorium pharaonis]
MSAFKRYQSKVFWNQMAVHDLEDDHFAGRNDPPRYSLNECKKEEPKEEEEENSTKSENDTVDNANITAIHVCNKSDENIKQNECRISLIRDESLTRRRMTTDETDKREEREEEEEEREIRNRSYSPLSQDFKSQDSGFSDSERSDCSEAYENATPRRKLRTKRVRRRRIQLASPWLEEGSSPMPTHTSTPKDTRIFARHRFRKSASSLSRERRADEKRDEASKVPSSVSVQSGENLCDFLYASEPPEDSVQPSITKSRASTNGSANATAVGRDVLNSRNYRQSSSMRAWLTDLATTTESECGSTLQSKNLPRRGVRVMSGEVHARDLKKLSSAATAAASKLLVSAEHFEQHYRSIVEKITQLEGGRFEMELLRSIEETAFSILSQLGAPPPRRIQQGNQRSIVAQLQNMKMYVDSTVDTRLDFYIEKIVRSLEEAPRGDSSVTRGALAALTALGLSDPRAGSSIARCSGIKALLTCLVTIGHTPDDLVATSLRALASACSSATAIEYFAREGGPEILTDLLNAESTSEKEKTEATALVVQITASWTNARGLPYLEPFADSLIPSLNWVVENTNCAQTLLLAAAALNQLSKSRICATIILEEDSVRKLLRSVKKFVGGNVWLMEQVAALIGELARLPEGRSHLAKARASVALVSFLRMRPPGLEDAYKRLEVTATAALTRLCVEPEIARQVVAVGGGDCLSEPYKVNEPEADQKDEEAQTGTGLFRYTRSLRRACKKAAKQIGIAKAKDHSPLD